MQKKKTGTKEKIKSKIEIRKFSFGYVWLKIKGIFKKKSEYDLNKDGVIDKKDKSIAGKVLRKKF